MANNLKMHLVSSLLSVVNGFPFKQIYGGVGHILMFHRVMPASNAPRLFANSYLEVSPEFLEDTILYYKSHNYKFISMDDLLPHIRQRNPEPFVVFTFDDGFKDNLEHAYPVFKKHHVPFTIYITTDFPEHKAILWWNHLETLVLAHSSLGISLNDHQHSFTCESNEDKNATFKAIAGLIKTGSFSELNERLTQIFHPYDIDPFSGIEHLALSWDEILDLHSTEEAIIGAHTVTHPALSTLPDDLAFQEMRRSKQLIEEKLVSPVKHFAFPFGGPTEIGPREIQFAEKIGFETAVTTFSSNVHKAHHSFPYSLPRIAVGMSMNHSTLDLIRYGLIPFIRNKGKRLVTI